MLKENIKVDYYENDKKIFKGSKICCYKSIHKYRCNK